ncbi:MAG: DUF2294 domain-containing protein [Clostridium sp.]
MTKGQVEALLSEAISKFEIEHMGRGPERIKTHILKDLIIIRLQGFLTVSEKKLAERAEGVHLVREVRAALFECSRDNLIQAIKSVIDIEVVSIFSDIGFESGEKIIAITVNKNIEEII